MTGFSSDTSWMPSSKSQATLRACRTSIHRYTDAPRTTAGLPAGRVPPEHGEHLGILPHILLWEPAGQLRDYPDGCGCPVAATLLRRRDAVGHFPDRRRRALRFRSCRLPIRPALGLDWLHHPIGAIGQHRLAAIVGRTCNPPAFSPYHIQSTLAACIESDYHASCSLASCCL